MQPDIVAPVHLSLEDLAVGLNACFEGYVVPAQFSAALLSNMIRVEAVDLASSYVAVDSGGVVGAALIAKRDRNSRVAAMGVAKRARRQGLGRHLMLRAIEDAKTRVDTCLSLEVIEQNPPAIALYESVGFKKEFRLVGFNIKLESLPPKDPEKLFQDDLETVPLTAVAQAVRGRGYKAASWSMSAATIEQLAAPSTGVHCGGAFAVVAIAGEEFVGCRSMAFAPKPNVKAAKAWLVAMGRAYGGRTLRMPAFFPEPEFKKVMLDAGMQLDEISQFQMRLDI